MNEGAAGVRKKSHAGDDRGIPPFEERRVRHPADDLVVNKLRVYLPLKREDNQRAIPLHLGIPFQRSGITV